MADEIKLIFTVNKKSILLILNNKNQSKAIHEALYVVRPDEYLQYQ